MKGDQNTACLVELHYLPCIYYLSVFFNYQEVHIESHEHYQKGSYRNRCYIASAQGPEMLSVPLLKGKNQQQSITEVQIAYHTPWYAQHWHAIQTTYGKAPFFIHYEDDLREVLYSRYETLYELNMHMLKWLLEKTHAPARVMSTTEYSTQVDKGITDLRNSIKPDLSFQTSLYIQVFMDRQGFISNLSALDLLMNVGPEAYGYVNKLLAAGS